MFRLGAFSTHSRNVARRFQSSSGENSVLNADSSNKLNKFYHKSAVVLGLVTPLAFVLSPSSVNLPFDVFLGLLLPVHAHIGLNSVVSDYVPKSTRPLARGAVLALSLITAAGLLKLNLQGPGVTATIKSLWNKPSKDNKH